MLQNNPILKSKIDQLWNKFWAGGSANPLTAIKQITCLPVKRRACLTGVRISIKKF
jgi:type I restriction enzyme M protein